VESLVRIIFENMAKGKLRVDSRAIRSTLPVDLQEAYSIYRQNPNKFNESNNDNIARH